MNYTREKRQHRSKFDVKLSIMTLGFQINDYLLAKYHQATTRTD